MDHGTLITTALWTNWRIYNEFQKWPCDFAWVFILELGTWTLCLMTSVWSLSHSNELPWVLNPEQTCVYLKDINNTPAYDPGSTETKQHCRWGPSTGVFTSIWSDSECTLQHWEALRGLDSWRGSFMKFKTWDPKSSQIKLSQMFTLCSSLHPSEAR